MITYVCKYYKLLKYDSYGAILKCPYEEAAGPVMYGDNQVFAPEPPICPGDIRRDDNGNRICMIEEVNQCRWMKEKLWL